MNQLRLTQKVQKAAGLKPSDLTKINKSGIGLGSWTVNLFNQDRRKVLVFVNDLTLYSFILFGVRKEHYKNLPQTFSNGLYQLLSIDGFNEKDMVYLMSGLEDITFPKQTARRFGVT